MLYTWIQTDITLRIVKTCCLDLNSCSNLQMCNLIRSQYLHYMNSSLVKSITPFLIFFYFSIKAYLFIFNKFLSIFVMELIDVTSEELTYAAVGKINGRLFHLWTNLSETLSRYGKSSPRKLLKQTFATGYINNSCLTNCFLLRCNWAAVCKYNSCVSIWDLFHSLSRSISRLNSLYCDINSESENIFIKWNKMILF